MASYFCFSGQSDHWILHIIMSLLCKNNYKLQLVIVDLYEEMQFLSWSRTAASPPWLLQIHKQLMAATHLRSYPTKCCWFRKWRLTCFPSFYQHHQTDCKSQCVLPSSTTFNENIWCWEWKCLMLRMVLSSCHCEALRAHLEKRCLTSVNIIIMLNGCYHYKQV